MLHSGIHSDEEERTRFQTEAETIARLQHPGIVQIFDVGEQSTGAGGAPRPYLALEFCPGGNLQQKLNNTPMPVREAATLVETLAKSVHLAHEAKVLHRDLKPANVLLTLDGQPKTHRFWVGQETRRRRQDAIGKGHGHSELHASRASPGQTQRARPTCDVYSLGAILYECLTGRPPFRAATVHETLLQVVRDEPIPPSQFNRTVPQDLETICLKALAKHPLHRYPTAQALADDVRRFLNRKPIAARPVSTLERGWRWCCRNPLVASLLAAVVLVLLLGTGVSASLAVSASTAANAPTERRRQPASKASVRTARS